MNKPLLRSLSFSITANAHLTDICSPRLSMQWTSTVDFSLPSTSISGTPSQSGQWPQRPPPKASSDLSYKPDANCLAPLRPDALPHSEITTRQQRDSGLVDFDVSCDFIGPPPSQHIKVGVPFAWTAFLVNRSDRTRNLALIVLPKRQHAENRATGPISAARGDYHKTPQIADAVVDENIVYAMHKSAGVESADIICLSADVRVGTLAPSACHEVELRFMALKTGLVSIEAIRVVDLENQEHIDVNDLPLVLVSPA